MEPSITPDKVALSDIQSKVSLLLTFQMVSDAFIDESSSFFEIFKIRIYIPTKRFAYKRFWPVYDFSFWFLLVIPLHNSKPKAATWAATQQAAEWSGQSLP